MVDMLLGTCMGLLLGAVASLAMSRYIVGSGGIKRIRASGIMVIGYFALMFSIIAADFFGPIYVLKAVGHYNDHNSLIAVAIAGIMQITTILVIAAKDK